MPNYPQPEILRVEVSMNGVDYSNSKKEFGFYDPFVLNVSPKLIAKDGSTKVKVNGFGFVDTSDNNDLKTKFEGVDNCPTCVKSAKYISKNTLETATPPYSEVRKDGKKLANTDPLDVEVSVFGNDYTDNDIQVFYYDKPTYTQPSPAGVPANGQDPILIPTDFKLQTNSLEMLKEHGNYSCRFHSQT